ncbi:astacin-like metalloendopeptidase [Rhinatrema bivittatum]|uniref:astacin-like metalloendopeptidase n=1 Tax=Rhinatrema bivittatum TaxID=194408 RepID=UPI001128E8BB|nr:astacin-like metalloendopeptidase [Rhinatrema bivittatum]
MQQGDIALQKSRSALACPGHACFWPKSSAGTVKVPYTISSVYNATDKTLIAAAMQEFTTLTCIRFVARTTESDYVQIKSVDGCWSYLGRIGGPQDLSLLRSGCMSKGIIQHELNHVLGFVHEQTRSDRDQYVQIMWQYIPQAVVSNFMKAEPETNNLGLDYDYTSVMHYGRFAFTNTSGEATIVPKPDSSVEIGQRYGLSNLDISKINKLYQCGTCSSLLSDWTGFLTSANYSSHYSDNSDCVWLIRLPADKVLLQFDAFDVQSTPGCVSDYLRVYDGDSQSSPVLLDRACGSGEIPSLIASSNLLLVQFVSDGTIAGNGFKASYSSVKCGTVLTKNTGTLASPGSPNNYPPNTDCTWVIAAPQGNKVSLTVIFFLLEMSRNCKYDYLVILDGSKLSSPSRGKYCGNQIVPNMVSTGSSLLFQFHSDKSVQYAGFQVKYSFGQKLRDGSSLRNHWEPYPAGSLNEERSPEPLAEVETPGLLVNLILSGTKVKRPQGHRQPVKWIIWPLVNPNPPRALWGRSVLNYPSEIWSPFSNLTAPVNDVQTQKFTLGKK